jgi:hypothetical protein
MNSTTAFGLRCLGTGLFLGNAVLLAVVATAEITQDHLILAGLTGLQGALAYAGIGAAVPQIEPRIGNKSEEVLEEEKEVGK